MNIKNILIVVISVIIAIAGFLLFRKKTVITAGTENSTQPGSGSGATPGTTPVVPEVDPVDKIIATLSENQKMSANVLASKIFNDMKGWGAHEMTLFNQLFNYNKAQFVYFVLKAWPIYSKKPLESELLKQNWGALHPKSKLAGYNKVKAEELIQKIIYRIYNTQL